MISFFKTYLSAYTYRFAFRRVAFGALVLGFLAGVTVDVAGEQIYERIEAEEYIELWNEGDHQGALDAQTKVMERYQGMVTIQWVLDRADLLVAIGRVDEAIAFLEEHSWRFPALQWKLATLYHYRGRTVEFRQTLEWASEGTRSRYFDRSNPGNLLVVGKIAEWRGDNPRTILSDIYTVVIEENPDFVPGHLAAGDLALKKNSWNMASQHYEKALEIDKANQHALAGLAKCYWKSKDDRLEETLKKILDTNSNHPVAKAIETEKLLDVGKTDDALEVIEAMLAVNPVSIRFLSLQSAAYFLKDDPEGMKETQEKVLQFNPHGSEVYRTAGRIASRHYRFREGAELQKRALEVNAEDSEALALYAFDLLRQGAEKEGREALEKAFEADSYNVQVFNMLELLDSMKSFATVEKDPFSLQLPEKEVPFLADDALSMLMEAWELYERKYDITLETPVFVQIFDNHDDFMVRSVGLPGNVGHLGICFGRLVTMDSPSARPKHGVNWRSVLWHEFVHVITLQKTKNRMPRWLSEGISVYEETQRSSAWGQRMNPAFKRMVDSESYSSPVDLEELFTQPKSPQSLMFGYFLAGEFVGFYVAEYGMDALVDALDRIGQAEETLAALSNACEEKPGQLEKRFKKYLEDRLAAYKNLPDMSQPGWREASSPFTDAMKLGTDALSESRWDEAESEFEKALKLFPDYSEGNGPLDHLIALYDRSGKKDQLMEALEKKIGMDSTAYPACTKLIDLFKNDENWPEVVRVADWTLGIDPFDVAVRESLLEARLNLGQQEEALELLSELAILDPAHAVERRVKRAEVLIQGENWPQAKREIIALLEERPHYWEAQKILLEIVDRSPGKEEWTETEIPSSS